MKHKCLALSLVGFENGPSVIIPGICPVTLKVPPVPPAIPEEPLWVPPARSETACKRGWVVCFLPSVRCLCAPSRCPRCSLTRSLRRGPRLVWGSSRAGGRPRPAAVSGARCPPPLGAMTAVGLCGRPLSGEGGSLPLLVYTEGFLKHYKLGLNFVCFLFVSIDMIIWLFLFSLLVGFEILN